jgi:hypothetical protein
MAKQRNRHARVGALEGAKLATRREKGRARTQRFVAKKKAQGLPVYSAAALAHKQLRQRSQVHYVKGEKV